MNAIRRDVFQTTSFVLRTLESRKTGRKHYEVSLSDAFRWNRATVDRMPEIRAHFDPYGSRGERHGFRWKFRTRKEAEQLILTATLRWGA